MVEMAFPTQERGRRPRRIKTPDVERIKELCDTAYNNTLATRLRMIGDYQLYRLSPFTWRQIISDRIPPNSATFTSNEPRTLADTVISILSESRISVRSPTIDQPEPVRDAGRAAEQLFNGIITKAEEDRSLLVETSLKQQIAFYMCIRGFVAGLHTFSKTPNGETVFHTEIWDPLNVYWGVASDSGGEGPGTHRLDWICHYQDLDAWRIDARFGNGAGSISGTLTPDYEHEGKPMFRVYDFYDREYNTVVADDMVVKRQKHFGQGYVPATVIPVGPAPFIVDAQSATGYPEDFGSSIFAHNRDLYPKVNAILSSKYERTLRMVNPATVQRSTTGRFTLPANISNPYDRGNRYRLSTMNEEDIQPLRQPDLPRDALELEASLQVQIQKGGVPNIVHGQSATPSSGYNTSLLISSQRHILQPRLDAMRQFYMGLERFTRRQFSTGFFEPMRLQGEIDRRTPYNRLIEPSVVSQAPAPIFQCRVKNPAELAQRIALFQATTQGQDPAFDLAYALDEVLEVDDPDSMLARLAIQSAKRALPQTRIYEAIKAAEEIGDEMLAKLLAGALMQLMGGPPDTQGQGGGQPGGPPARGPRPPSGAGPQPAQATRPDTNAGGSPQAGMPNESTEAQNMGRPRPEGTR